MQDSSDQQIEQNIIINQSLNQTANSVHNENNLQQNRQMYEFDSFLMQFLHEELEISQNGFKFDDLQQNFVFKDYEIKLIEPIPKVYFLPYHLIFLNKGNQQQSSQYSHNLKLDQIRNNIEDLNIKEKRQYEISYNQQKQNILIRLHNKAQLVHYNIRTLKIDKKLHKQCQLLDHTHLIDKLYLYYEKYYQKLYFKETSIFILYWAYQKDLFNYELTEHTLKIIIICNFINFGYGVTNVIEQYSRNPQKIKQNKAMNTFTKINRHGQTEIDDALINKFKNYTIHEKRGFYMVSKKRFLQIKDIVSINFPLLPLPAAQNKRQIERVTKNIEAITKNESENVSICKNISKIFKFLHNKFDKRIKLIIDFEIGLAYRQQYSQNFELEIFHPVLATIMLKLTGSSMRKLKAQVKAIHDQFARYADIRDIMKEMLSKKRP